MHGNRDFLLGRKFFRRTGCRLLPEEYVVNISGKPVLLLHGDTLCTEDTAYLRFRKRARNWFMQQLFLLKPLSKRRAIAQKYREASAVHTSTTPLDIMDVTPAAVEAVMQKHHVYQLIHGHTHRPGIHRFSLNYQPAERIVLGPWHEHGSAFICRGTAVKN